MMGFVRQLTTIDMYLDVQKKLKHLLLLNVFALELNLDNTKQD